MMWVTTEKNDIIDKTIYSNADYYSNETVAENNARADKLMRQLRRFAVENAENDLNWKDINQSQFYIFYDYTIDCIEYNYVYNARDAFQIYFDTEETCRKAIETFKDELIWYFTEYRDRV